MIVKTCRGRDQGVCCDNSGARARALSARIAAAGANAANHLAAIVFNATRGGAEGRAAIIGRRASSARARPLVTLLAANAVRGWNPGENKEPG